MIASSYSIKKQLLIWISIPVFFATLLILILSFAFSWIEIEEVYDAQLVHSAKVLLQVTEHEILDKKSSAIQLGAENSSLSHKYEKKTAFRIWYKDHLVTASTSAQGFGALEAPPGFSDQYVNENSWRFFVFIDEKSGLRIETAERYAIRYELISQLMSSLLLPLLLLLPILFAAVWIGAYKSLKPLVALSDAVDIRHADDLTEIKFANVPREVTPLVQAMNRLLRRISESFKREREFTDHAAHELRTPLAAIKTQAQVLKRKSAHLPDFQDGFENLNSTIDRSTRLIDQLLSLARIQNESFDLERTDLSENLYHDLQDIRLLAEAKKQTVITDIADAVIVRGHPGGMSILIRNILENAVKYTPEGGTLHVQLTQDGLLEIADTGAGLSDADKGRVFKRFTRADSSGQSGSGLGLAIAEWVAHAHGVKILLEDNLPSGLKVKIQWTAI